MAPLLLPAVAPAFVGLVQGAAISQSVPNSDGSYPDSSGDSRSQGIANIASGWRTSPPESWWRWSSSLLADLAGYIEMPSLAALLMLVGVRTLNPDRVLMVWRTGASQATVMATTFVLTMLIPLQYTVVGGAAISVVLFVANQSAKVTVTRWVFQAGSPSCDTTTRSPRSTATCSSPGSANGCSPR